MHDRVPLDEAVAAGGRPVAGDGGSDQEGTAGVIDLRPARPEDELSGAVQRSEGQDPAA